MVMKGAQVQVTVRLPVASLLNEIAELQGIKLPLASVSWEGDEFVLSFGSPRTPTDPETAAFFPPESPNTRMHKLSLGTSDVNDSTIGKGLQASTKSRRRRASKRNRMKTRGWNVVQKMQNAQGQTVTIYEPFVAALRGVSGSRRKKEQTVANILKANGNKPGRESIRYYLENTLNYLATENST